MDQRSTFNFGDGGAPGQGEEVGGATVHGGQAGRQEGHAGSATQDNPGLGNLLNQQETCYAASVVQACLAMDLQLNLVHAADGGHQQLAHTLQEILTRRKIPHNPAFPVLELVVKLNQVLGPRSQFELGTQECAREFFGRLIDNIIVTPTFFTRLHEEAICPACNTVSRRGVQQESDAILCVSPPEQVHPLVVIDLVQAQLSAPVTGMVCTSLNTCNGRQVAGHTVQQLGENTVVWVCRNTGSGTKTMTPVSEPIPSQRWNGQECRAVLAHCGRSVARGKANIRTPTFCSA